MGLGDQGRACWQYEVFQWPKRLVPVVNCRLKPFDFAQLERLISRHCQLASQVKQAVLAGRQYLDQFLKARCLDPLLMQAGQQQAQLAV